MDVCRAFLDCCSRSSFRTWSCFLGILDFVISDSCATSPATTPPKDSSGSRESPKMTANKDKQGNISANKDKTCSDTHKDRHILYLTEPTMTGHNSRSKVDDKHRMTDHGIPQGVRKPPMNHFGSSLLKQMSAPGTHQSSYVVIGTREDAHGTSFCPCQFTPKPPKYAHQTMIPIISCSRSCLSLMSIWEV